MKQFHTNIYCIKPNLRPIRKYTKDRPEFWAMVVSLYTNGQLKPIITQQNQFGYHVIINGHLRYAAAWHLGFSTMYCQEGE